MRNAVRKCNVAAKITVSEEQSLIAGAEIYASDKSN